MICLFSFVSMWTAIYAPLCLLLLFTRADALFGYALLRCQLTSSGEAVFLEQVFFNKVLLGQYNSTMGNVTGYTKEAMEMAVVLNHKERFMRQMERNTKLCQAVISWGVEVFSKTVEPSVTLRSVTALGSEHPNTLVCSAYNFYPKQIDVTWLKNGEKVTSDVYSAEEVPNGNWLYQAHSYLDFTPKPGDKIQCMVEHISLKRPMIREWETASGSERNKYAAGASVLVLGLLVLLAGMIYFRRNNNGRILVPGG